MKFFKCFGKLHFLKNVECPINIRRKISGHHRHVYPWDLSLQVSLSHILEWSKDSEVASGPLSSQRRTSKKLMISTIYILSESGSSRNFSCAPHNNGSFSRHLLWKEPVAKSYWAWIVLVLCEDAVKHTRIVIWMFYTIGHVCKASSKLPFIWREKENSVQYFSELWMALNPNCMGSVISSCIFHFSLSSCTCH